MAQQRCVVSVKAPRVVVEVVVVEALLYWGTVALWHSSVVLFPSRLPACESRLRLLATTLLLYYYHHHYLLPPLPTTTTATYYDQ